MVFFRTLWGFYRTNNHVEGWHSGMKPKFQKARGNVLKFIRVIHKECLERRQLLWRIEAWREELPATPPHILARNDRIWNIVQDYQNRDKLGFLRGLAYNFQFGRHE